MFMLQAYINHDDDRRLGLAQEITFEAPSLSSQ
jgi:hypothetical protein